jgi:hypothetical protein
MRTGSLSQVDHGGKILLGFGGGYGLHRYILCKTDKMHKINKIIK